jgi:hypothetical protein
MIALRLVRLIETHSDKIARNLVKKIQTSPRTSDFQEVPELQLLAGIRELLQHLSEWLVTKTDIDVETRYRDIGARLAGQGVALAHSCWAAVMTKEHLWDFLQRQGYIRSPIELYGEMELLWFLDRFFDRVLCCVVEGYTQSQCSEAQAGRPPQARYREVNLASFVP